MRAPGRTGRTLLAALGALALSACLPRLPEGAFTEGTVGLVRTARGQVLAAGPDDPPPGPPLLRLQYLGVAGWRIQTRETVLLTAPLLSNPGLLEVGVGGALGVDTLRIREALRRWEVRSLEPVAAILSGHGHYDHLLDVPWIAARLAPRARILTNRTSLIQLRPYGESLGLDPGRVEDVEPLAAGPRAMGRWIRVGEDMRILPILSDHAPHFAGHVLYDGERRSDMPEPPGAAHEWLAGTSLAFLIDVLDPDGSVALRLYFQDAIPREPGGRLPPPHLLGDTVPVDLALLVPASYAEVQWHPEALVQHLRPAHVLVQHWEDFFRSPLEPARPVAFTSLPVFMDRLERVMGCADCFHVPLPGTRFGVWRTRDPGRVGEGEARTGGSGRGRLSVEEVGLP